MSRWFVFLFICACVSAQGDATLFAKPGRMVSVGKGSRLSLYCVGRGSPTIFLESGFGGGTAETWLRLQPLLGKLTRTCSYDRAGYGFSELGTNLPRDLKTSVADLSVLMERSGEKPPYILAGHSNGGLIVGAFADLYPQKVAALIFFDAAVALPEDTASMAKPSEISGSSLAHLEKIRRCLARAKTGLTPVAGDECTDPNWYSDLPPDLAKVELANGCKVDYWRAYLSEAESNYSSKSSGQARALLPHKWTRLPVRVFIASTGQSGRAIAERRQEQLCDGVEDCRVVQVATANHLVHNEALNDVLSTVEKLLAR